MTTTLTLKNIPDELYGVLTQAARRNRRSLNSEAIVCLESVLLPHTVSHQDRLARARQLRQNLAVGAFAASDIDSFRTQGRA
ncbi:hypothetical protein [Rhodoferax sp.]|uniref:FitA-like ribbon-helix-helix domain-containing protein n=1 Tax=Rhodoferax sp. TaxID=50421 RepID=UPI00260BF8D4|nr:hypothetical protein [Rhodoferax sp.]MDD2810936.1 hypothetical protein [Rhodoferax sp.]MDD4942963.1 hypothetical protein [Rhodoferax sp.]